MELRDRLETALGDRYEIESELGRGGMAQVFAARDRALGRPVAIKVLRPELASAVDARRFEREMSVTANLRHPHILKLLESPPAREGLLYYVMERVDGESLAQRLAREKQLPLETAMSILRQTADALDYAHRHGIVHRDVKPGNILLEDGNVFVADFGLARLAEGVDQTRLTEPTFVLGTAAYMSPEQFAADPVVDARSDVYSLACVFFEMLAGDPPFTGATQETLRRKHLGAEPPRICAERPNCPAWFDTVIRRALAKVPADRYASAGEFVRALETGETGERAARLGTGRAPASRRRWVRLAGSAVALVLALAALMLVRRPGARAAPTGDPGVYVVLPFAEGATGAAQPAERLAEALAEWDGVRLVDGARVRDVLSEREGRAMRLRDGIEIARAVGAGRLVWVEAARLSDSIRLSGTLYDPSSSEQLAAAVTSHAIGSAPTTVHFRQLVNGLLRARSEWPWLGATASPRQSLAAWRAYDEGRLAASRWDIALAERKFSEAVAADPDHALAHLWLGRMRIWAGRSRDEWRAPAQRAIELRDRLSAIDALAAEGQLALAEGRFPDACAAYEAVIAKEPASVAGWFGLGECRQRDSLVVSDPRSPSGFSFRASWQRALDAYRRLLDHVPPPHPDFVYTRAANLLYVEANRVRGGRRAGERRNTYFAHVARDNDTLAFTPYPIQRLEGVPPTLLDAVEQNRRELRALYERWLAASPRSWQAHLAMATLLEMTGELVPSRSGHSALQAIETARSLATDSLALELGRTEIRVLVKARRWEAAANLADSLLRSATDRQGATVAALAGPAALTGRVGILSQLFLDQAPGFEIMTPGGAPPPLRPELRREVARLRAFATLGVCTDEVRAAPQRIGRLVESYYNDAQRRRETRDQLLRRPLSLAAPCLGLTSLRVVSDGGDPAVAIQLALANNDVAGVRTLLERRARQRQSGRPGDVAIDYTFLEAWVLARMGDSAAAAQHLDHSLDAIATLGTHLLDQPAQSAGLVRAMMLRAQLADALGDRPTATRWARVVTTLWSRADEELRSELAGMRALAIAAR